MYTSGASYFLTILDDFSRVISVYLILEKSEVAIVLKEFFAMVKTQFNKTVKKVQAIMTRNLHV